jgi:hypothetical protein
LKRGRQKPVEKDFEKRRSQKKRSPENDVKKTILGK